MFNWREVPFFRILLPFILGILAYLFFAVTFNSFNFLLLFLACSLAIVAFLKIQFRWKGFVGLLVNAFFLLLGYQMAYYHNDWNNKDHFKQYLTEENLILGIVDNAPEKNERTIRINLSVQQLGRDHQSLYPCSGKVLLYLRNDTINQELNYGDLILVKARINAVQKTLNPEAFDFKKYLQYKNIHYQGFVPTGRWQKLESDHGNPILDLAYKMRLNLLSTLKKRLTSENELAVAAALILGHKQDLSDELKSAYSDTGAMHVLAVSGLHTGLIWGIVAFLLKWIRWRHRAWKYIKSGIMISALWFFALITGASPSVLRAATMFTFLIIGMSMNRSTNIYNTLAGSAFCLLLFNPFLIVEVGFQLSYLAVTGIVYFYKKIYNLWYIENKIGDYLWSLTAIALAAQLTTFPLSLFYFHQFPAYFWLSGLVVVPFAFLILGTGLFLFFIENTLPFLSPLIGEILSAIIWLMNAFIFLIAQFPSDFFKNVWIGETTMILLYLIIICIAISINSRKFKWLIAAVGLLTLMSFSSAFKNIFSQTNPTIVFYHLQGKSHVEFIENEKAISFGDRDISEKNLKFTRMNFHKKNGIQECVPFYFGEQVDTLDNWYTENNFVQFFDKKVVFVDDLPDKNFDKKIKVDFVVFRKRSKVGVAEVNQFFDYEKIVFDGALYDQRLFSLKKECQDLNAPYYDINREGALIITID